MPNLLHNTRLRLQTLLTVSVLALTALLPAEICLAEQAEPVLAAESIDFEGGVVILDKKLLEHRDWVIQTVEQEIKQAKLANTVDHRAIQRTATTMTDTAFDLVGYEKQGELYEELRERCREELVDAESPGFLLPDRVTVFILNHKTAKDYLRAGGTLPFLTYRARNDRVSFSATANFDQRDVLLPNIMLIEGVGMVGEDDFTVESLSQMLGRYLSLKSLLPDKWAEAIEGLPPDPPQFPHQTMSLVEAAGVLAGPLLKANSQLVEDEHTSWFSKGFIYAFGEDVLETMDAQRAAMLMREMRTMEADPAVDFPDEFGSHTYLRYQTRTTVRFKASTYDDMLSDARLAANISEADRLLAHLGPERVPVLMRILKEEQINTTAKLEAAIYKHFDYDMTARLNRYQPEGDAETLYNALIKKAFEQRAAGQPQAMAHTLNRAQEIQFGSVMADKPAIYRMIYDIIENLEGEHVGRATLINAWWTVAMRKSQPPNNDYMTTLAGLWAKQAIAANDLRLAYPLLDRLDEEPLDFASLDLTGQISEQFIKLVRASKLIDDGELAEAQRLIDAVRRDFPEAASKSIIEAFLNPNLEHLEMRINTQRPQVPQLG